MFSSDSFLYRISYISSKMVTGRLLYRIQPSSESGTGAFRYRSGSPYSGTRLFLSSAFIFHFDTGLTKCREFDILAFKIIIRVGGSARRRVARRVQCSSTGCSVAQQSTTQLSRVQRSPVRSQCSSVRCSIL
jgi:hypothetical protein